MAMLAIALLAPASAGASSLITPQAAASKPIVPAAAPAPAAPPSAPQAPDPSAGSQTSSGQQSLKPEGNPLLDMIPDNADDSAMTDIAPRFQNPFIQNPFVSPTIADLIDAAVWDAGEIDPSIYVRALVDGKDGLIDPGQRDPGIFEPLLSDGSPASQGSGTQGPQDTNPCPKGETSEGRGILCPD